MHHIKSLIIQTVNQNINTIGNDSGKLTTLMQTIRFNLKTTFFVNSAAVSIGARNKARADC